MSTTPPTISRPSTPSQPLQQRQTPPTPPPAASLRPTTLTPPRSDSLSNRSPRLGQASFDESVAYGTGSPRLMQPRRLFPEEQSPLGTANDKGSISDETLDMIQIPMSRDPSESSMGNFKRPVSSFKRETSTRPPMLNLASDQQMLPNLRYSTTSSSHSPPRSPTPSGSESTSDSSPERPAIKPSIGLLFTVTTRSTLWTIVLPAFALSIAAGLIPPYMTQVLGETLQHFTNYTAALANPELTNELLSAARSNLLNGVRIEAIKFAALGAAVLVISGANQALWVVHGERVAKSMRLKVYEGLNAKGLDWFDKGMGGSNGEGETEATGDSAAGLMGRFTK